jgi:acetyl esterase/lipase
MLSDAERVAHRANEAGVEVTLAVYDSMPHGFTRFDIGIGNQALQDAVRWCHAALGTQAAR